MNFVAVIRARGPEQQAGAGWGDYLKTEPGKPSPLERPLGSSKYSEELYPETIELKRWDIELLADCFRNIRGELETITRPG